MPCCQGCGRQADKIWIKTDNEKQEKSFEKNKTCEELHLGGNSCTEEGVGIAV